MARFPANSVNHPDPDRRVHGLGTACGGKGPGEPARQPSSRAARMGIVDLARIAWLTTVLACVVAVLILVLDGYFGYAGVTFAVAVSAAINLA